MDARPGAHVDDPVDVLDDVQVVFDDDDRVAQVRQPVHDRKQFGDVVEVQPGRRFVQQVQRPAGVGSGQLRGQFDPLGLAAGQRRGGLTQGDVIQPDVAQRLQHAGDLLVPGEQFQRFADRHCQYVGDRLAVVLHLQRRRAVLTSAAILARHPDVGQEVHFDLQLSAALARLAATAGDVERERPRGELPLRRFRHAGELLADQVEHAGVRRRRAGGTVAQRRLIDADDLVDVTQPLDRGVLAGTQPGAVQPPGHRGVQDAVDQRAFAAARRTGHRRHHAQRDRHIDRSQVVFGRPADGDPLAALGRPPHARHRHPLGAVEEPGGVGSVPVGRFCRNRTTPRRLPGPSCAVGRAVSARPPYRWDAFRGDAAAVAAGFGAEVAHAVGTGDDVAVVLDDQQRVAQVPQPVQRREQPQVVPRVQSDRRFI